MIVDLTHQSDHLHSSNQASHQHSSQKRSQLFTAADVTTAIYPTLSATAADLQITIKIVNQTYC